MGPMGWDTPEKISCDNQRTDAIIQYAGVINSVRLWRRRQSLCMWSESPNNSSRYLETVVKFLRHLETISISISRVPREYLKNISREPWEYLETILWLVLKITRLQKLHGPKQSAVMYCLNPVPPFKSLHIIVAMTEEEDDPKCVQNSFSFWSSVQHRLRLVSWRKEARPQSRTDSE